MSSARERLLLDHFFPTFDHRNHHAIIVHAPPARVHAALWAVTIEDMPLARLLMTVRALPVLLAMRRRPPQDTHRPLLHIFLARNFALLADEPDTELVMGAIDQSWKLRGGTTHRIADTGDFVAFIEPGFVKIATNFCLTPTGDGTRLSTETRIRATDAVARRQFNSYWRVIRIGSGIIRRELLRAIKRRAERPESSPDL